MSRKVIEYEVDCAMEDYINSGNLKGRLTSECVADGRRGANQSGNIHSLGFVT